MLKCAELERCEKTTLKVWLVIAICRIIYAKALLYEYCTVAKLKKWGGYLHTILAIPGVVVLSKSVRLKIMIRGKHFLADAYPYK